MSKEAVHPIQTDDQDDFDYELPSYMDKLKIGEMRDPSWGPLTLSIAKDTVIRAGKGTQLLDIGWLTNTENGKKQRMQPMWYKFLWCLMRLSPDVYFSETEFREFVYPSDKEDPISNVIEVTVNKVRRALEAVESPIKIENEQVKGWRLSTPKAP